MGINYQCSLSPYHVQAVCICRALGLGERDCFNSECESVTEDFP